MEKIIHWGVIGSGGIAKRRTIPEGTIGQEASGEMVAYLEQDEAGYDAQQQRKTTEGISISPDPVNTYLAEIDDFSKAILDGRSPLNGAESGLRNQQILAACYESAKTGRTVRI